MNTAGRLVPQRGDGADRPGRLLGPRPVADKDGADSFCRSLLPQGGRTYSVDEAGRREVCTGTQQPDICPLSRPAEPVGQSRGCEDRSDGLVIGRGMRMGRGTSRYSTTPEDVRGNAITSHLNQRCLIWGQGRFRG